MTQENKQKAPTGVSSIPVVRCKVCKWWSDEIPVNVHTKNPMPELPRYCLHASTNREGVKDGMISEDGYGAVETGPEFGCVHGEMASTPNIKAER